MRLGASTLVLHRKCLLAVRLLMKLDHVGNTGNAQAYFRQRHGRDHANALTALHFG